VEIDFSSARTIRDITTSPEWAEVNLSVTVSGSHLVIADDSGGDGPIIVEDLDSTTADALGIAGSVRSRNLTGDDIFFVETVGDVLRIINSHADNDDGAGGRKLQASISDNAPGLTLTDSTSGDQVFSVVALNGSQAALDLGIAGRAAGDTIESRRLLAGMNTVLLRSLNGGSGVSQRLTPDTTLAALHRGVGVPAGQIRITTRDGTQVDVDLTTASTIADVKTAIESASSNLSVTLSGAHLVITDQSLADDQTPVSDLLIEDLSGGTTAQALGIAGSTSENTLTGLDLYANVGDIRLTDRSGLTAMVDLSNAQTLAQVIAAINAAPTAISASVSDSGLGIELVDSSGGTGDLVIEDLPGSTTAADLNIAFSGPQEVVASGNLQRQYVSSATLLAALGDEGVPAGKFRITDSQGNSALIDLTQGNEVTLQDVIDEINSRGLGVAARINDNGDGLLLEDLAAGAGQLTVSEEGGTTARALGILGTANQGQDFIDGSFETQILVTAGDTLDDVLAEVRDSRARVNAAIINDGTDARPYRLSLTSSISGRDGRLAIDVGTTGLSFDTLMEARDATVLFGSPDADAPLVLTSSTNTLRNVIPGVRLDLVAPSDEPVTVTLTHDIDAITGDLSSFVSAFNNAISQIDELTRFDPETETRGLLTGDSTARRVRQRLINMVSGTIGDLPAIMNRLSRIGITLSKGSSLQFDEEDFRTAVESDPDGVTELFTHEQENADGESVITGFGGLIQKELERLTESDTGLIPISEQALQATEKVLNDRIDQLEILSGRRRQRLLAQFYAMEAALARLQTQQTALTGLTILNLGSQTQF
jgi:flagellar hook-associated protein 2